MMPPVIINYNGLSERQKNCVHHVHMPVIITICPKIAGAKAWEPPAARFRSVFNTISPLDIKHPQSMGEHFLRPVGCCRFLGLLTTDTTRTNKLPIFSGVFAEAYTVLAIIVFYHCFSLSPRLAVRTAVVVYVVGLSDLRRRTQRQPGQGSQPRTVPAPPRSR